MGDLGTGKLDDRPVPQRLFRFFLFLRCGQATPVVATDLPLRFGVWRYVSDLAPEASKVLPTRNILAIFAYGQVIDVGFRRDGSPIDTVAIKLRLIGSYGFFLVAKRVRPTRYRVLDVRFLSMTPTEGLIPRMQLD